MTAFRGYLTRRAWARSKWRALHRLPQQARQAVKGWWWRASGYARRLEYEAANNRLFAHQQFDRARRAEAVAYYLKYPPAGDGQSLRLAADEIDRQGQSAACENAWMESDTGAWNCVAENGGGICWCSVAEDLRQLDKALTEGAEFNLALDSK